MPSTQTPGVSPTGAAKRTQTTAHSTPGDPFQAIRARSGIDPVAVLTATDGDRVPELVPIRYGRMSVSPFTFLRGSASVMAADLAALPMSGLAVQLCGDAHLSNFGLFASPERRLLFDLNDFDETYVGSFEFDVWRLVASLAVAGRDNGLSRSKREKVVHAAATAYVTAMTGLAQASTLDVWYSRVDVDDVSPMVEQRLGTAQRADLDRATSRARRRDTQHALGRVTEVVDGERRFATQAPKQVRLIDLMSGADAERVWQAVRSVVVGYLASLPAERRHLLSQYRMVDVARRVVGVGSVGTRCWVALCLGVGEDDPLLLQIKEARASVLAPHTPVPPAERAFGSAGERVVVGQRLMQAASDIALGWTRSDSIDGVTRDYYVRQLRDWKGSFRVELMTAKSLRTYGQACAATLARAHARSGDRIAIAAHVAADDAGESFARSALAFAEAYADQSEADHAALVAAIERGEVLADLG